MKLFYLFFLLLAVTFQSFSQESNTYILKTIRFLPILKMEKALGLQKSNNLRAIFEDLNLYSIEIKDNSVILSRLRENKFVDFIERDENLVLRKTPNDENYSEQYGLKQIMADKVWDFTTGGVTFDGDTIVIAVLDGGCDIFNKDLFDNIWINNHEIPYDNIDNDGNGFIDDYYGVNILTKNGIHKVKNHGTSVAGIIGAIGDNSIGITGINWNVKILPITDILSKKRLIEGYGYAYKLRKKYNESNGKEGAFIVCTNFSGGSIFPEFPEDSEENLAWCKVYDKLGEVGIINVASTDNSYRNVDILGDMPSLCQSNYLLTVASTDENDKFYHGSAYSKKNVDIAAPGHNIFSLKSNNEIDTSFNGNSAAAPMIAGAIGLLYTIPCEEFIQEVKKNPSETGLKIKEFIMKYSDKHSDLLEKTSSGGRLNIIESYVNFLENECSELDFRELNITKIFPNPAHSKININYKINNYHNHKIIIFNNLGQIVYKEEFRPSPYDVETKRIDVSHFSKGVYYFSLISKQKTVTKQIMIY